MMKCVSVLTLIITAVSAASPPITPAPRLLDKFSTGYMMEDGVRKGAAPECKDSLGWVYYNGHCYMFTRSPVSFLVSLIHEKEIDVKNHLHLQISLS